MTSTPVLPSGISEEKKPGLSIPRIAIIAAGVLIGVIVLLFIIALVVALTANVEQASAVIRTIRDLVIIFLALEGALIVISLAILVLQVARLIALLTTEVKPILENTQETLRTAQGTVQFVSETIATPIVRTSAVIASFSAFSREAFGLRHALSRVKERRDA